MTRIIDDASVLSQAPVFRLVYFGRPGCRPVAGSGDAAVTLTDHGTSLIVDGKYRVG